MVTGTALPVSAANLFLRELILSQSMQFYFCIVDNVLVRVVLLATMLIILLESIKYVDPSFVAAAAMLLSHPSTISIILWSGLVVLSVAVSLNQTFPSTASAPPNGWHLSPPKWCRCIYWWFRPPGRWVSNLPMYACQGSVYSTPLSRQNTY